MAKRLSGVQNQLTYKSPIFVNYEVTDNLSQFSWNETKEMIYSSLSRVEPVLVGAMFKRGFP